MTNGKDGGSMSKTIDVMDGDKFTICPDGTVFQYRDGKCRSVNAHRVSNWWPDDLINDEYEITERAAKKFFDWWGYTITPAAKPEANGNCQQESKPETLTQAKPADVPTCAVHLRSDAHLSAVIGRVNGIADWMYALESRLASLEKPADKDAAYIKAMREVCESHIRIENAAVALEQSDDPGDDIYAELQDAKDALHDAIKSYRTLSTPESEVKRG